MEARMEGLPEKLQLGPGGASDDDLPGGLKPVDSWHISAGDKDGRGMHLTFQALVIYLGSPRAQAELSNFLLK